MKKASLIGIVSVLSVGSLLHFVYEWSGRMPIVGAFGAVNESIWEHLKLIFWPMLVYGIVEWFWYGKRLDAFWPVRTLSILGAMAAITVLYYTYSGILGQHYFWADIVIYLLAVVGAYLLSLHFLKRKATPSPLAQGLSIAVLFLCAVAFVHFTFSPPSIGLFAQPQ